MIQTIYWEAHYADGTSTSEANGAQYSDIDRSKLTLFRIRDHEGPIVELPVEHGRAGVNLVYRRRTTMVQGGGKKVIYLVGWVPQGPILAIDPDNFQVYESPSFKEGDPMFYPPAPIPEAGEGWTLSTPTRIVNPAFERTD